jgi:hypothetical protein
MMRRPNQSMKMPEPSPARPPNELPIYDFGLRVWAGEQVGWPGLLMYLQWQGCTNAVTMREG